MYFLLHSKKKDHTQVSHTTGVALAERTPTQDSDRQPLPPSTQSSSHKPEVLQSTWKQPGSATTKAILVSTCSVSSFSYTKMVQSQKSTTNFVSTWSSSEDRQRGLHWRLCSRGVSHQWLLQATLPPRFTALTNTQSACPHLERGSFPTANLVC